MEMKINKEMVNKYTDAVYAAYYKEEDPIARRDLESTLEFLGVVREKLEFAKCKTIRIGIRGR
jgi:hypothetical protein